MGAAISDLVEGAMGSPWIYLALCAFAMIDGFFPLVPSESLVVSAGVFAATGEPNLVAVIGVAALGAFAGDHISYLIGRTAGGPLGSGRRRAAALKRGGRLLTDRGGTILIVCRLHSGRAHGDHADRGRDPLPAALVLGIALTVTLLVEVVRHLRRQRTIPAHC